MGSKKPSGALAPTMSVAAMETAEEEAGRATAATREPTKDAEGTNAEALCRSGGGDGGGGGGVDYSSFFCFWWGAAKILQMNSRKPTPKAVKWIRPRESRGVCGGGGIREQVGRGKGRDRCVGGREWGTSAGKRPAVSFVWQTKFCTPMYDKAGQQFENRSDRG